MGGSGEGEKKTKPKKLYKEDAQIPTKLNKNLKLYVFYCYTFLVTKQKSLLKKLQWHKKREGLKETS